LQLVKQRISVAQGTPKKRKRSPEQTPSVERMFESVAGPSNSRRPCLPTKSPKSPSKKLRASSDSEDVVEIAVPSSDIDEDEITTNPARLNPQGIPFFLKCFRQLTSSSQFFSIDDDVVRCPICNAKVRYKRLNTHMDNNCKDPRSADSTSKTWSKIMARPNITQQKGKNKYVTRASWYHLNWD
jgi:E3 ubiquitin-protein ligase RAD18